VFGYTLALPIAIFSSLQRWPGLCGEFCEELWPDQLDTMPSTARRVYGTTVVLMQFGLPLIICSACYYAISRRLDAQIRKRCQQQVLLADSKQRLIGRKTRTTRMMTTMLCCFSIAWLPINLLNIIRDFELSSQPLQHWFTLLFAAAHVIAMTSTICNPVCNLQ
jgi:hypothetical protein